MLHVVIGAAGILANLIPSDKRQQTQTTNVIVYSNSSVVIVKEYGKNNYKERSAETFSPNGRSQARINAEGWLQY